MFVHELFEANWFDKSPIVKVLKENKGKFVHFSRVPKLGINPSSTKAHKDPHGIYFYPIDWILSQPERVKSGNQYGFEWPYYFIADIDFSLPGLDISKITNEQIKQIATNNDWQKFLTFSDDHPIASYARTNIPGAFLWHFVDALQNKKLITWEKAFKGYYWIRDPGTGTIHNHEPDQLIVMSQKCIKTVQMFENKGVKTEETFAEWEYLIKELFLKVAEQYDGKIRWEQSGDYKQVGEKRRKRSYPTVNWFQNGAKFQLHVGKHLYLCLRFQKGREEDDVIVAKYEHFRDKSPEDLLDMIHRKVEELAVRTEELRFIPVIKEENARELIQIILPSGETSERIDNDSKSISFTRSHSFGPFQTIVNVFVRDKEFSISINIRNGSDVLIYNRSNLEYLVDEEQVAFDDNLKQIVNAIKGLSAKIGPDGWSRNKFYTRSDLEEFIGWLVLNSRLDFNGLIFDQFTDEIKKFETLDRNDRAYVMKQIKEKFTSK